MIREIIYKPIGIIHSPYRKPKGTPIQPTAGKNIEGTVEVFPEFAEGLKDLDGFSHIILLYHFHLTAEAKLSVKPFMDDKEHGIFAIRGSARPNPIGLSVTRLLKVEGNILHIGDVDIVEGTPLLDIKPFVPEFDTKQNVKTGWLEKNIYKLQSLKDDGRFVK